MSTLEVEYSAGGNWEKEHPIRTFRAEVFVSVKTVPFKIWDGTPASYTSIGLLGKSGRTYHRTCQESPEEIMRRVEEALVDQKAVDPTADAWWAGSRWSRPVDEEPRGQQITMGFHDEAEGAEERLRGNLEAMR